LNADYFRTLYDYLYWARDKVLAAGEGISEEEYAKPNGFTYGSIRGILSHCLGGEVIWLSRARGDVTAGLGPPPGPLLPENVPTVEALRTRWQDEESKHMTFLAGLKDDDIEADVLFRGRDGAEVRWPLWQILTLVYHHTIQHRSEAAEALTMVGRSPGNLDFMVYMRERHQ
jgi:uncharacterized damage-inducible protein DinB